MPVHGGLRFSSQASIGAACSLHGYHDRAPRVSPEWGSAGRSARGAGLCPRRPWSDGWKGGGLATPIQIGDRSPLRLMLSVMRITQEQAGTHASTLWLTGRGATETPAHMNTKHYVQTVCSATWAVRTSPGMVRLIGRKPPSRITQLRTRGLTSNSSAGRR